MNNCEKNPWPTNLKKSTLINIYNGGKTKKIIDTIQIVGLTKQQLAKELCQSFSTTPYRVLQRNCLNTKNNTLHDCLKSNEVSKYDEIGNDTCETFVFFQ